MTKRLKVLSLRNVIAFGGPDTTLLGWYGQIDRDRFDISMALFQNPGSPESDLLQPLEALGIPTFPVPYGERKNVFGALREIVGILRREGIDLLHTHDFRSDVLGYVSARLTGVPVMSTIYVWFSEHSLGKVKYQEAIQRLFVRRMDGITAIGEATRRDTVRLCRLPEERVTTVVSGIQVEKLEPRVKGLEIRKSIGAHPEDRLMLFVARIWPEKAHTYLLKAMRPVVQEFSRAKLVIVGEGPLRAGLESEARELGIASSVIFTGKRKDVPDLLSVAEFMIHPSLAEAIPMAVCEGMGAGLAIIGTDVDGIPEVVQHEQTGLIVAPKDVPALSAAIGTLLRDPCYARKLGAAGRVWIGREYSLERATDQLEAFYTELCREHGVKP